MWKMTSYQVKVENFTFNNYDENFLEWHNCNLCCSIFDKTASVRKHIAAKHTMKSKPEKPEQKNMKKIKDDDGDAKRQEN